LDTIKAIGVRFKVGVLLSRFLIIPMNDLNIPIPFRDEKTKTGYIEITVVQATGARETKRYERDGGWIKMSRNGQYVNVLSSVDGVNWTTLEQYTVPTLETIYMGSTISAVVSKLDINDLAASDSVFYLYTDHIGTPVKAISNDRREIVWARKDFKIGASPFGFDQMPNGRNLHDGLIAMPLRFPGQYYDQETGTNYNYFRDYDPSIGRYIQSDPIGLGGGLNTYGYVGGNPIQFVDRFGLTAECPTGPPMNDPNWIPYTGDPEVFHCGFNGYLESRQPTPDDPIGECFYDSCGALVDDKHEYALCGGTPDQYLFDPEESNRIKRFINGFNHSVRDTGGINHKGFGAFMESNKYREENYGGDE
jgi:RHS repeat-associated protein